MSRFASTLLLLILLSSAVGAQNKDITAPAPAAAQPGETQVDSSARCGPSMGPDSRGSFPEGSTILAGIVHGPKCAKIENARVILVGGDYIQIAESDAAGEFFFIDPMPKFFSLIVEKDGFKTAYVYGLGAVPSKLTTVRVPLEVGPSMKANVIHANAD